MIDALVCAILTLLFLFHSLYVPFIVFLFFSFIFGLNLSYLYRTHCIPCQLQHVIKLKRLLLFFFFFELKKENDERSHTVCDSAPSTLLRTISVAFLTPHSFNHIGPPLSPFDRNVTICAHTFLSFFSIRKCMCTNGVGALNNSVEMRPNSVNIEYINSCIIEAHETHIQI